MKIIITETQYKKLKDGWNVVNNKLVKTYKFENYDEVIDFVNDVAEIAEKQNHHPDMVVKYDNVKLTMFDHEANDITDKCYKFTNAVDRKISREKTIHEKYINQLVQNILLESKKDILVNKLGFAENVAQQLEQLCGNLAVWLGKKIQKHFIEKYANLYSSEHYDQNIIVKEKLKSPRLLKDMDELIYSIMDWYRVGLNGNIRQYENLSFTELYLKSVDWHKSLEIGEGEINYVDENEIIRDYTQNGIGFYWVNLGTNYSEEECNRMGHCGRTNTYNTLYSLREYRRINDKYTLNKSHLTAAIGDSDGIIYQLKGAKNSKPNEIYFPYITDLLINNTDIKGFGSEYDSESDFKITDLPDDEIRKIYDIRPDLFNTYSLKKYLKRNKIVDIELPDTIIDYKIEPENIGDFVEGDYKFGIYKDKNGNTKYKYFFETLLSGDVYDLYENYNNDAWEYSVDSINKENEIKIREYLKKNPDYDESYTLEENINNCDYDVVKRAINHAISNAESDEFYNYAYKELKNALEDYGQVESLDDEGAKIIIDVSYFFGQLNDDNLINEIIDDCKQDFRCVFYELVAYGHIDKPKFYLDDRWTPYVSDSEFNESLKWRLEEL